MDITYRSDVRFGNMIEPKKEYQDALVVLNQYYARLVPALAEDILARKEEFDEFGVAEQIVKKYAPKFRELNAVYTPLRWAAMRKAKPYANERLREDQFRCFGCGGIINQDEQYCRVCGWTWK